MMLCFSLAQAFTPGFTNSVFYFRPHLWGFLQSLQRSAKACFQSLLEGGWVNIPSCVPRRERLG